MNVSQLIEELQKLPQDKDIVCQVVGQKTGAWSMNFEFIDVKKSWMIQLRVDHPTLENLSMDWDEQTTGKD